MKKLLSIFLCVVLLVSTSPLSVFSVGAEQYTEGYYTYTVENDEATITGCNTSISGDIVIPSTLGGYPVTTIGYEAFASCSSLTNITIPNSVITIGEGVFDYCTSLTSVTIGNRVKAIGDLIFYNCVLLKSITVSENNKYYSAQDGVLFNKDKTTLVCCLPSKRGEYIIPNSVKNIDEYAFFRCFTLESITIPNSVTGIGYGAFSHCNLLTSITIPDSVTSIDESVFEGCGSLESVTIPDSVKTIGEYAFDRCDALTDVYYKGTMAKALKITIGSGNDCLTNATWHYETTTDFNGDSVTDRTDYQYIANVYTGKVKVENKLELCDMNGDGKFDIRDIIAINEIINA